MCDECNKVFKTLPWFTKHMQAGVHRAPAVSMKQFVAKHMQFYVRRSKQVTSMPNGEGGERWRRAASPTTHGRLCSECNSVQAGLGEETQKATRCTLYARGKTVSAGLLLSCL